MRVEPLDISRVALSGVTLIEASAGTGKTYTLAALYVRLLLESELTVDQILVVTYTRAATAELRVRIRGRVAQTLHALQHGAPVQDAVLGALCEQANNAGRTKRLCAQLEQALAEFDRAAIFTIHGFCQRVLQRNAFESGAPFDSELSEDQSLLLEEVVSDFWANRLSLADERFAAALAHAGLTIPSLLRFVQRSLPNPQLQLVPEPAAADVLAAARQFAQARDRAVQLWEAQRAQLIELLLGSGLNRRSYAEDAITGKFAPALDMLGACTASGLPDSVRRLTPQALQKAATKGRQAPEHPFFTACQQLVAAASALLAAERAQVHGFMRELLEYARSELKRRSQARGVLGFEDLLTRLHEALCDERGPRLSEAVRGSYRAALIDEFQDTDPVQLEVFRRIYAAPGRPRGPLFLIGDPKQAIYAFRGADVFAYLAAARQTIDRVCTLQVNYRSDPELLSAVGCVFERAARPFVFEEISFHPVAPRPGAEQAMAGPALEFLLLERAPQMQDKPLSKADAQALLPARIAAEIAELLRSRALVAGVPVQPGHIAVLCRTNAQAGQVQTALRELGIPAVLDGDASVFDSAMAEELGRWLWAMAEPVDSARIRAALVGAGIGLSAPDLLALERDEAAWDAWVVRFHRYQSAWQTRGFLAALHTLCDELEVAERLLVLPDGERRYTDLWHLSELLHEEEQRTRKGPRALLDFYRRVREGSAQREGMALEDVQLRLESDTQAVILTTIHKSKGLEYPIVYCPYLWSGATLSQTDKSMPLFHDRQAGDRPVLMLPLTKDDGAHAQALGAAQSEALAEGTRLLYVALTRAKHRLSIVWGAVHGVEESALAYVLHAGEPSLLRRCSDAQLKAPLLQLQAAHPQALCVRPLRDAQAAPGFELAPAGAQRLAARVARFSEQPAARVGSFSSLIEREPWGAEPEPLDRDALAQREAEAAAEQLEAAGRVALSDFPAGAGFGHLVHAIYEHADFELPDAQALRPVVAQALSDYGGTSDWEGQLAQAIFETLHTPLSAAGGALPSLASIARGKRLNELEFVFPVAEAALATDAATSAGLGTDAATSAALSPRRLGQLLAAHARNPEERAYAEQLARLRFAPLRGFLRGFIDLALEHAGQYYIIDYKSNRLGDTAADYRGARLQLEMRRHHYVLQYLIYCVALHRYLSLRLRGYDYDAHFGGVYYLFVRGMSPANPPGSGVFFERPPRALIAELCGCFSHPQVQR